MLCRQQHCAQRQAKHTPSRGQRRIRPSARSAIVAPALAALLWLLIPRVVSAHAHLVQADPAPGSVIARAPAVASFLFDEPLNPTLTRVRLLDAAGRTVTTAPGYLASGRDNELWQLPLPRLPVGTYSVLWTSESAIDGHVMSSFYTFRIDPAGRSAGLDAATVARAGLTATDGANMFLEISTSASVAAFVLWLGQLAQAVWLGALVVEVAVLAPARQSAAAPEARLASTATRRVWSLGSAALVAVITSLLSAVVCLAVQGAGGNWGVALAPATLAGIFSSQNGQILLARFAVLLGALLISKRVPVPIAALKEGIPAWPDRPVQRAKRALGIVAPIAVPGWTSIRAVMIVLAGVYMVLVALSGHAADVQPVWLFAGIDWVHLVGTAAWIGGIAALAYGVMPCRHLLAPEERARAILPLLDRFSPVAYAAVGSLALSGVFNALSHLHTPAEVAGTTYGHLLALKTLLVGALMALSASHVRHTRPLIARAQHWLNEHPCFPAIVHEGLATLAARLRLEVGIGALVLLMTVLMGQTPPSAAVPATTTGTTGMAGMAGRAGTTPISIAGTAVKGDLRIRLGVAPPAVGTTTFTLKVWERGRPVTADMGAVLVHLYPLGQAAMRANLAPVGHGASFTARGSLAMAGTWHADVLVRTVAADYYRVVPFAFRVGSGARFLSPLIKPAPH